MLLIGLCISCKGKFRFGEYKIYPYPIGYRTELVWIDTLKCATIEQVVQPEFHHRFHNIKQDERLTLKSYVVWIKTQIQKFPPTDAIYLELNKNYSKVNLYLLAPNGVITEKQIVSKYLPFYKLSKEEAKQVIFIRLITPPYRTGIGYHIFSDTEVLNRLYHNRFYYGITAGILLLCLAFTMLLFIFFRDTFYLFYLGYIVSFVFYLFVQKAHLHVMFNWNGTHGLYIYGVPYGLMTIFLLLYTRGFLETKKYLPKIDAVLRLLIVLKSILILAGISTSISYFYHPAIDYCLLFVALLTGYYQFRQNFRPARFFILSLLILFVGMGIHAIVDVLKVQPYFRTLRDSNFLFSFQNLGLLEILFFLVAMADRFRIIKKEKENAQTELYTALTIKQRLVETHNQELEAKVKERTYQLENAYIEIEKRNLLLKQNNIKLETEIVQLEQEKVLRKNVSFEEFRKIFPDENACLQYIVELKWKNGFICKKCNGIHYTPGRHPYARRCTRCRYEESPTVHTLFYRLHFSILKAFYIVFLVAEHREISSLQLSVMIGLRRQTCDEFKRKVIERMQLKKRPRNSTDGWSYLILE